MRGGRHKGETEALSVNGQRRSLVVHACKQVLEKGEAAGGIPTNIANHLFNEKTS